MRLLLLQLLIVYHLLVLELLVHLLGRLDLAWEASHRGRSSWLSADRRSSAQLGRAAGRVRIGADVRSNHGIGSRGHRRSGDDRRRSRGELGLLGGGFLGAGDNKIVDLLLHNAQILKQSLEELSTVVGVRQA